MNIHHLELFYYVARYGGISEAVRSIPYGIQQPAVSGQVAQLEEFLGVTLFQRRPFALTAEGARLYEFAKPFFSNLETTAAELQGGRTTRLRVGASTTVLRDHLPEILRELRLKFPALKVTLRDAYPAQLEQLIERDEIDLAITLIEKKAAPGLQSLRLLKLPIVLLVQEKSVIKSSGDIWRNDPVKETLIALPQEESLCRAFQQWLSRKGVDWFTSMEVSSLDLIETYVRNGFGIGLSFAQPNANRPGGLRELPIEDCLPLELGALWRGKATPVIKALLEHTQRHVEGVRGKKG
jgi:DNA-binding transcriptional LysR family regulator